MRIQKKFSGQFLGVCIFLVSIIFSMIGGFIFQIDKYKEYSSQITQLNKDIEEADRKIEQLKEIESSQNEDDIEYIARERLNMVKENEIIYFTEKEVKSN